MAAPMLLRKWEGCPMAATPGVGLPNINNSTARALENGAGKSESIPHDLHWIRGGDGGLVGVPFVGSGRNIGPCRAACCVSKKDVAVPARQLIYVNFPLVDLL
jgi:hypothetical protein